MLLRTLRAGRDKRGLDPLSELSIFFASIIVVLYKPFSGFAGLSNLVLGAAWVGVAPPLCRGNQPSPTSAAQISLACRDQYIAVLPKFIIQDIVFVKRKIGNRTDGTTG